MRSNTEIWRMDAMSIAEKVRTAKLTPSEVVEAVLARMSAVDPQLNAYCTPTPDLARENGTPA